MSEPAVFAVEAGRSEPGAAMFRVSDFYLAAAAVDPDWSQPVQFRLAPRDDGTFELEVRTVDLEGNPFSE